ncbi:hypothetical protein RVF83_22555 [Gordonia rubripertincta]|uniref:Ribosomally synthesized peptide with SipW-like signal peptide n=2 Tax=Gordonia rubripertincta TaxID=36822 RepID=A0AAW4G5G5_GORRU|nr:hypothetical protein [Gordonia rubripertincta]ASR04175.1 hypothetical protein GCWB2_16975 [Gordonia rubripertincta]MBM7278420.1 hypothetical protein [Gordonia rubripertincta]MDG6779422.1 hypothetical protein [Gordonia rubripertincta]NKY62731.1 hypothetical protein [Gordonia rubripertincta]GAB85887.1 hypothetical protein GORBP_065_02180 [Gordonia rubripertincta NBRC 101908]
MPAAFTRRGILLAALAIVVAVLFFGSVRTTGALWAERRDVSSSNITTGTLGLAPGAGGGSFTFPALNGSNVVPGQAQQAVLHVTNTGSTPLRFRLATAGPSVSTPGATVTVNLSGAPASNCPGTGTPLTGAFTAQDSSAPGTVFTSPWSPLAVGAVTSWCIRATLVSVTGAQPATFTITFGFAAEQTRP